MKRRVIAVSALLITAVLLSALGCCILSDSEPRMRVIENADGIYESAAATVSAAQDAVLTISKSLEFTVEDDLFMESAQQTLSYTAMGTDEMRASLAETLNYDGHKVWISELFANETGYVTVEDSHFSAQISTQEYQERLTPAVPLTAQLYGSIIGFDTGDGYVINFTQPHQAEAWALNEGCQLVEARGTAYVSYDGILSKSIYSILYTRGNIRNLLTVTVEAALTTENIELPADTSVYTPVAYFDGPRLLERASGYLLQADNIRSEYTDNINFQAFGDERTETKALHTYNDGLWSARVDSNVTLANDSRVGQSSVFAQTELFSENAYRVSADGAAPTADPEITEAAMRTYCQDLLLGTVMLPRYINGAEMSETEGTLRVTFAANEAFAQQIASTACQTLYQEPEMLNDLSQKSTTNALQCYLELDKSTGLPVASGISYSGTYTIEGLPYLLRFQADQGYTFLKQAIKTAGG